MRGCQGEDSWPSRVTSHTPFLNTSLHCWEVSLADSSAVLQWKFHSTNTHSEPYDEKQGSPEHTLQKDVHEGYFIVFCSLPHPHNGYQLSKLHLTQREGLVHFLLYIKNPYVTRQKYDLWRSFFVTVALSVCAISFLLKWLNSFFIHLFFGVGNLFSAKQWAIFVNFILPKDEPEHFSNTHVPLQIYTQTNQLKKTEVIPQFAPHSSFQLYDPKPVWSAFFICRQQATHPGYNFFKHYI